MSSKGHYPHQCTIDAYGDGGFRFADMSHRGSLLCLPTGMFAWSVTERHQITKKSLAPIFELAAQIDVLFIGLGDEIAFLDGELLTALRSCSIIVESIATGGAVRTYNIMMGESRAVAAALIAVERPNFGRRATR